MKIHPLFIQILLFLAYDSFTKVGAVDVIQCVTLPFMNISSGIKFSSFTIEVWEPRLKCFSQTVDRIRDVWVCFEAPKNPCRVYQTNITNF